MQQPDPEFHDNTVPVSLSFLNQQIPIANNPIWGYWIMAPRKCWTDARSLECGAAGSKDCRKGQGFLI